MAQDAGVAPDTERPPVELPPDRLVDHMLSAGLWGVGLGWLSTMMGLQIALHRVVDPRRIQWLERLYTRGQVALTGSRWRAVVDPGIDAQRPYLFFQNHVNHLDHCTMYCATPHFKQGGELKAHFDYPIYGTFMRGRGTIPVDTQSAAGMRTLIKGMRAELERGSSLLVFPEGTRTVTGHLSAFQPGVFRIAQQLGAPIVPVTVTGMYRVMRKKSLVIHPGHDVTVYCDAPIATQGLRRGDVPALMAQVRSVMESRLDAYWREQAAGRR